MNVKKTVLREGLNENISWFIITLVKSVEMNDVKRVAG
jgi:hypothetical protein